MTVFSGEARNSIVDAISPGFGHRAWGASGMERRFVGVSMMLGTIAFTQIEVPESSSASERVSAATAAFDAE